MDEDQNHPFDPDSVLAVEGFERAADFGKGLAVDWLETFATEIRAGKDIGSAACVANWECDV